MKLPVIEEMNASMQSSSENLNKQMPIIQKIFPDVILSSTLAIPWGAAAALNINCPHVWWIKEYGELDHGLEFYLTFQKTLDIIGANLPITWLSIRRLLKRPFLREWDIDECTVASNNVVLLEAEKTSKSFFRYPDSIKLLIFGSVLRSKGAG